MSGGAFDYNQYKITMISDDIQEIIEKCGKEKTTEELKDHYGYDWDRWIEKYPEDKFHYSYPPEVLLEFKNAVKYLKIAHIYAQRIDWLLSGDDAEESFLSRLKEELDEKNNN